MEPSYHPAFLQAHFSGLSIESDTTISLIKKLYMLIDSNCQIHLFELQMISQCHLKALEINDCTSSLKIGTNLETVCKHKTAEFFLFFFFFKGLLLLLLLLFVLTEAWTSSEKKPVGYKELEKKDKKKQQLKIKALKICDICQKYFVWGLQ